MLYCDFSQRSEEDFRVKNDQILCLLQSLLANANVLGVYYTKFLFTNTRPLFATSVLEMCSGKKRPSPESGRRCLMTERMLRELSRPVLCSLRLAKLS